MGQCCTQTSPKVTDEVLPQPHGSWGCCSGLGATEMQVVHLNASRWEVGTETSAWPCLVLGQPKPLVICKYWFQCSHFTAGQVDFCGNVPKRSSVTLLMPQYVTLNKPLNVFHLIHLQNWQPSNSLSWKHGQGLQLQ